MTFRLNSQSGLGAVIVPFSKGCIELQLSKILKIKISLYYVSHHDLEISNFGKLSEREGANLHVLWSSNQPIAKRSIMKKTAKVIWPRSIFLPVEVITLVVRFPMATYFSQKVFMQHVLLIRMLNY